MSTGARRRTALARRGAWVTGRAAAVGDSGIVGYDTAFHAMEVQTAARALEAAGRSVIHMEIGEPDFPTPPAVIAAAQAAIATGRLYYTSALGLPALREAIARHYAEHLGVDVAPQRIVV